MFDKFINQISKYGKLDTEEIEYLNSHSKIKFYKRSEFILQEGELPRYNYFTIDGCVRLFYNVDGKDKTTFFYNKGNFIWTGNSVKPLVPTQKKL